MEYTEKQVKNWKDKHGDIFAIESEGLTAIVSDPSQNLAVMKMAAAAAAKNGHLGRPAAIAEVVLNNCWVAGDAQIKTDPAHVIGVGDQIDELVDIPEYQLSIEGGVATIGVCNMECKVRLATRRDIKQAESANPKSKPFETEAKLIDLLVVDGADGADALKNIKNNNKLYLGLLLAAEELKTLKYASVKKL